MAESTSNGTLSGLKTLSPQGRKVMVMFGGAALLIVVVTGLMLSRRDKTAAIPAAVRMGQVPPGVSDPTAPTSSEYKKLVRETDRRRFDEAALVPGQMALPNMAGLTDMNAKPDPVPSVGPGITPAQQAAPAQAPSGAARPAQYDQHQNAAYTSLMTNMSKIVERSLGTGLAPTIIAAAAITAAPAAITAAPAGGAPAAEPPLIRAGSTYFAALDGAVSTDFSGPVVATIHAGPLKNARLLGTKALEQDGVVIKFNQLSPPDGGPAFPIEAYAIRISDAKTFGLTGLSGNTDYHVIQRFVLPAALAFMQTYGAAAAQPAQTVIQTNNGAIQTTPQLSAHDRLIVAAGAAGQPLATDVSRMAARPITQELDAGTEIGVQFVRDVTSTSPQPAPVAPAGGPATAVVSPLQPAVAPAPMALPQPPTAPAHGYPYQRTAYPTYGQYPAYGQQR